MRHRIFHDSPGEGDGIRAKNHKIIRQRKNDIFPGHRLMARFLLT